MSCYFKNEFLLHVKCLHVVQLVEHAAYIQKCFNPLYWYVFYGIQSHDQCAIALSFEKCLNVKNTEQIITCNGFTEQMYIKERTPSNFSKQMFYISFYRLAALTKDYCGSLSEKSVRMNFALIYELLDEMVVSVLSFICTLMKTIKS